MHTDYETDLPRDGEKPTAYAKRLEQDGQRELYIRKALRTHFDYTIAEVIAACNALPKARHRELTDLRKRFPDLSEARFAWRITQSLTLAKSDAKRWAADILEPEQKG